MIEMNCPHCGHQLRIDEKHRGKRGACKHCKGAIDVPAFSSPPPIPPSSATDEIEAELNAPSEFDKPFERTPGQDTPQSQLGCLFWLCVVFFPYVAIVWALLLPKTHPQKTLGWVVPCIWLAFGVMAMLSSDEKSSESERRGASTQSTQTRQQPVAIARPQQERSTPSRSGISYPSLSSGTVYQVRQQTPLHDAFKGIQSEELPANGYFRVVGKQNDGDVPWYNVQISDGYDDYAMWINSESLVGNQPQKIEETRATPQRSARQNNGPTQPTQQYGRAQGATTGDIVFLAPTGKKFHRSGCRTLKGNVKSVTRQSAQGQGYTACKVCGGG